MCTAAAERQLSPQHFNPTPPPTVAHIPYPQNMMCAKHDIARTCRAQQQPRVGAAHALHADAVTDCLSERLVSLRGHALRDTGCADAPVRMIETKRWLWRSQALMWVQ